MIKMERVDLPKPRISALLSFVVNGLGQIYNGEIKKGLTLIFLSCFSLLIFIIGAIFLFFFLTGGLTPVAFLLWGLILLFIGFIGIVIIGIYSISDAYDMAKKLRMKDEDETTSKKIS